jgi:hypothetical protein
VLEAATRHQLAEHLPEILPPIQAALCDPDAAVREAAGAAFGILFRGGAHSAVDSVVPSLLTGLDAESHYAASVEGLRVILGVRPATFNGVAPKLLKAPVTGAALRALGELAGVAGGLDGGAGGLMGGVGRFGRGGGVWRGCVVKRQLMITNCNNPRGCLQPCADTLTEFSDAYALRVCVV